MGVDLHRVPRHGGQGLPKSLPKSTVLFDIDEEFHSLVDSAGLRSNSSHIAADVRLRERLYHLAQAVDMTRGVQGLVAEAGCYRGLSAYLTCHYLQLADPCYRGESLHLFDSFEGLSKPSPEDRVDDPAIPVGGVPREAGLFSASLEEVKEALREFPLVSYHRGWIPDCFADAPDGPYRLVHVDLDLHDPTRDSLEFFYPRLAPGGLLICDDYGFVRWPGARTAVDEFCAAAGAPVLRLSSGDAMVFSPAGFEG